MVFDRVQIFGLAPKLSHTLVEEGEGDVMEEDEAPAIEDKSFSELGERAVFPRLSCPESFSD